MEDETPGQAYGKKIGGVDDEVPAYIPLYLPLVRIVDVHGIVNTFIVFPRAITLKTAGESRKEDIIVQPYVGHPAPCATSESSYDKILMWRNLSF